MDKRKLFFKPITPKTLSVFITVLTIMSATLLALLLDFLAVPGKTAILINLTATCISVTMGYLMIFFSYYQGYATSEGFHIYKPYSPRKLIPWNRILTITKSSSGDTDEYGYRANDFPLYQYDFFTRVITYSVLTDDGTITLPPLSNPADYKEFERYFELHGSLRFGGSHIRGTDTVEVWQRHGGPNRHTG